MDMWWSDWLFPKRCVGCDDFGSYLCSNCVNLLKAIDTPICPMCTKPFVSGKTHPKCQKPLGFDGLVAVFEHKYPTRRLISKLKYKFITDLYDDLTEILLSFTDFSSISDGAWLVVGVPLHKSRLNWRGFNQADELGKKLAQACGWEFETNVLLRTKKVKNQMELKRSDRLQNVKGIFAKGKNINRIKNKNVLLVDDVWTTGATMRECTKVLKRNGASKVWGLVVAR
jgi:competence protein ComFC